MTTAGRSRPGNRRLGINAEPVLYAISYIQRANREPPISDGSMIIDITDIIVYIIVIY
jgi:hypothetical protein